MNDGNVPTKVSPSFWCVTLVLITGQWTGTSATQLSGCPSPNAVAAAIAKIQQNNWSEISAERVETIWPTQFDELKCESEKACRLLVSKSRVISGHCECCEAFRFDIDHSESRLSNIIVHYSADKKEKVLDAAKTFAKAAGLPEAKMGTVGRDSVQRYEWTDSGDGVRQSYVAELRLTSFGTHWELYLSLTADPM
jgi:hypothetical protein